jgi:hypothetical protein
MLNIKTIIAVAALVLLVPTAILAQESSFSDPNVDYAFVLPGPEWKLVIKPSATSPNVEYVRTDRKEGYLEVRKLIVAKSAPLPDVMKSEEAKLQFLPGYVAGKEENFSGALRGSVFNYEFVRIGRNMSGRLYFLRSDDTTVFILRFTGERDRLKSIRNETDSIARTFSIKGAKAAGP